MTAKDIKILGVTVTYNNEDKIPYVMPYYERIGIDKLVVYDNGSTDRTVEMLSKYPFVEIRTYITDTYEEGTVLKYKTEIQNEFKGQYNWCISTYFDEVFYSKRDFREVLYEKMCEGKTCFRKTGLNIFSRHFPPVDNGKLIHENVGRGSLWTSDDGIIGIYGNKTELFDMNKVFVDYNKDGCHECQIFGDISLFEDEIAFFHLKFIDYDFIIRSNAEYAERTNGTDITCYDYFAKNMDKVYDMMEKRAISIDTYMNSKMKDLMPEQVVFLVNETKFDEQKKYIDWLNSWSKKDVIQQYGILFYGEDIKSVYDAWYYAKDNGVYTFFSYDTNHPITACMEHGKNFSTELIYNPWICKIDKSTIENNKSFPTIEHDLKNAAKEANLPVLLCGELFVKYESYVSPTTPSTLGCYMIVKNEEDCIKNCLDSIYDLCDEIVVVDTGCDDNTMKIVEEYGSKVKTYGFKWCKDFSAARNFAMSKMISDYCFTTDADEVFTPLLRQTISNLRANAFYGADSYEMWLLNYNGTDTPSYYLGGRQIVKRDAKNKWMYKVHEKLYFKGNDIRYIPKSQGYILHKHKKSASSNSNYNKYAEVYYNELNRNDKNIVPYDYTSHFFYYMFLTLKDIDLCLAKTYLYHAFEKRRFGMPNEDIRVHLYRDGYISLEEYTAMQDLANGGDIVNLADALSEDTAKYILYKTANECKMPLNENGSVFLAYNAYLNGDVKLFSNVTHESHELYKSNGSIRHNINFCKQYVDKFIDKTLVIDCTNGTNGLASNIFYFSKMFNRIKIKSNEDLSLFNLNICEKGDITEGDIIVDGNKQMNPKLALNIFESHMYGNE